jgi:hypothetical protein
MVTVDTAGKVHLYDFKTFRNEERFKDKAFTQYYNQVSVYKNIFE